MSRTAWMRVVRSEIQKYIRSEPELSRREFVSLSTRALGLGLIATSPLPRLLFAQEKRTSGNAVIVGAGLAGLTTAYRLAQQGIAVKIYEAQNRIGGRVYTQFNANSEGQFIELGAELIDSTHKDIISLARELHLEIDDFRQEDIGTEPFSLLFENQVRTSADFLRDGKPLFQKLIQDYSDLEKPNQLQTLDHLSLKQYLDSIPLLKAWVRTFMIKAFEGEFGLPAEEQSAMGMVSMLGAETSSGSPFGASDECMRIKGGNSRLTEILEQKLKSFGVEFHLGSKLVSMDLLKNQELELHFDTGTVKTRDSVVLTLPVSILRTIRGISQLPLSTATHQAIAELGMGQNSKSMMEFKTKVWRTAHRQSGLVFTDLKIENLWDTSRGQKGTTGILTHFLSRGEEPPTNEELPIQMKLLEPAVPGISLAYSKRLGAFHWPRFPHAMGSYSCPKVGQWVLQQSAFQEMPFGVNLFFAGEHCSKEYFGFMNGAVESANRTAQNIIISNQKKPSRPLARV